MMNHTSVATLWNTSYYTHTEHLAEYVCFIMCVAVCMLH